MVELLVCAKLVYDLENVLAEEWRVSDDSRSIPIESAGRIMNECDANALELALRLRDRMGPEAVRVTVLTAGGADCKKMLTNARAVGADRCIRVPQPSEASFLSRVTAQTLCAVIRGLGRFDLLLFGASAGEYDMGQTGLLAAERLGLPVIPEVCSVEPAADGGFTVTHLTDAGLARTTVRGPAVLTVGAPPGVCLRSPTLKAVLAAAKCPEETIETENQAPAMSGKALDKLYIPARGKTCRMLDAGQPEAAAALIRALLEEGGDPD